MKIFSTLSGKKEDVNIPKDREVSFYACGPTVYNYAHIGNLRAYIFEDILRRTLEYAGYKVRHVMNITDVEDKIIRECRERGIGLKEYTSKYIDAFRDDCKSLNMLSPLVTPLATEHIDEMIFIISDLMNKGYAYKGEDGSVYFSVNKFKEYGQLHNLDRENMVSGARISNDEYSKDSYGDFALWKSWDENDGNIYWDTTIGKGRPGWHIECSAMSMKHLTKAFENGRYEPEKFSTIDFHCGGVDNVFPHHENEITQVEASAGKKFVNYWVHCEHLLSEGKKMSKSLGNFYTLRDLIDLGYSYREIRFVLANCHYRSKLNFTKDSLEAARVSLKRIDNFVEYLSEVMEQNAEVKLLSKSETDFAREQLNFFKNDVFDDLNISAAFSRVFDLIRFYNTNKSLSNAGAVEIQGVLREMDKILGVIYFLQEKKREFCPVEIEKMIAERNIARKSKKFADADKIRKDLLSKGVEIKDTPEKTVWKYM